MLKTKIKNAVNLTPLSLSYTRKVGNMTFRISSFGNPASGLTAGQMLLRFMLQRKTARENILADKRGES